MKRITSPNNLVALPAPLADINAPGYFANNPGAGPGTVVDGDWLNGVQEEILAAILAAGLAPSKADLGQLLKSMQLIRGWQLATASGNFIVPAGIIRVTAAVWGGGGSGAGNVGDGGGGGGFALKRCTVAPGDVIAMTIGLGGAQSAGAGNAGGTSSFGAFCSATGGGATIANGVGIGGDVNVTGGRGGPTTVGVPGPGGGAPFGGAGGPWTQGGQVPGGGGGGGTSGGSSGGGAIGAILVLW
jgi:hypothetical protein